MMILKSIKYSQYLIFNVYLNKSANISWVSSLVVPRKSIRVSLETPTILKDVYQW